MSQVISLRLDDEIIKALQDRKIDGESMNATAKRILMDSLGIQSKQPVHNTSDERLQELIDSKVAYLATAMNDLRHNLENEISQLKTELEIIKLSPTATTKTAPRGGSKVLTKK